MKKFIEFKIENKDAKDLYVAAMNVWLKRPNPPAWAWDNLGAMISIIHEKNPNTKVK